MDATGFVEFFGSDRAGGVEEAAIDPVLDFVKVDGDKGLAVTVVVKNKARGEQICVNRQENRERTGEEENGQGAYTLLKPRLGYRRVRGDCPPSKPGTGFPLPALAF